jgi:hypothetical protein
MEQEVLNFITNEILDLFCSYKDRRIWDILRDMLFRHGSQSEELISSEIWKHNNLSRNQDNNKFRQRKPQHLKDLNYGKRSMCKSARIIICFVLTIMSHFKEEARKEMHKPSQDPQNANQ